MKKRKCPICGGSGKEEGYYPYMTYCDRICGFCKGRGNISMKLYMEYIRAHRKCENQ